MCKKSEMYILLATNPRLYYEVINLQYPMEHKLMKVS